jgi:hypothetical protein
VKVLSKTPEILLDFPTLDEKTVLAVIAFAAVSAEEDLPVQAVPTIAWRSSWMKTYPPDWRHCLNAWGIRWKP